MTINSFADNREAREVWASLPLEEAYPIGSRWTHTTYGAQVHRIAGHRGSSGLMVHTEGTPPGTATEWPRSALDNYGNPAPPAESTPPEEARPLEAGDRVKVTVSRDIPGKVGKVGTIERVDPNDPRLPYLVKLDDETYAGWVSDVERVEESTPLEPFAVGSRVRLIDAGGDSSSSAQVGDVGTVTETAFSPYGILEVRMADGHLTRRDRRRWEDANTAPAMPPATPETFTAAELESKLEEARREARREGRQAATREFDEWKSMAQVTAHQYAQDNSLCQEFDRCMVAIGLEPRDSWEGEEYCVTVTYDIHVTAHNSDAAESEALNRIRNDAYIAPETIEAEPA